MMSDPLEGGKVKNTSRQASANTSAIAFRYDELGLDLEKYTTPAGTVNYGNDNKPEDEQQRLQFEEKAEDLPF